MDRSILLEEEIASYRWEKNDAIWESVQEDAEGNIVSLLAEEKTGRSKHRKLTDRIRRGLIRYLLVAVDSSQSAADIDYRPCRLEVVKRELKSFIREYFDQNPISQFGLIVTKDRVAESLTELSGNPKSHETKLSTLLNKVGEASLQNTLILAINVLRNVPDYGSRELLIIFNSLKTRDPSDIFTTIEEAKKYKIRVNVICTAAELFICRYITEQTGGQFVVAVDSSHFSELLLQFSIPPPEYQQREVLTTDFIYMGFPKRSVQSKQVFVLDNNAISQHTTSFVCPRCYVRTTELPTQCSVCRLQLNSSSHIARSHHHLFPLPNYTEIPPSLQQLKNNSVIKDNKNYSTITAVDGGGGDATGDRGVVKVESNCFGCLDELVSDSSHWQCPNCCKIFCGECDIFIHDSLHNCPGCL